MAPNDPERTQRRAEDEARTLRAVLPALLLTVLHLGALVGLSKLTLFLRRGRMHAHHAGPDDPLQMALGEALTWMYIASSLPILAAERVGASFGQPELGLPVGAALIYLGWLWATRRMV